MVYMYCTFNAFVLPAARLLGVSWQHNALQATRAAGGCGTYNRTCSRPMINSFTRQLRAFLF